MGRAGFLTEDEARLELKRRQVALADGKARPASGDKLTFDTYARRWLAGHSVGENTRAYVSRVIDDVESHIGRLRLADILPSDLAATYRALEAGVGRASTTKGGGPLAQSTVARYAGWLVTIFNAAIEDGLIAKNPASNRRSGRPKGSVAKRKKPIVVWTPEQARHFCSWASATQQHWADAYEILVRTGLRIGELFGLEWPDIDLSRATLTVARQVRTVPGNGEDRQRLAPPKGGRIRTIRLDNTSVRILQELRRKQMSAQQSPRLTRHAVFIDRPGAKATKAAFLHALHRAQDQYAAAHPDVILPRVCTHDLRHTHASLLLSANIDIKVIQERLGHATAKLTLDTYAHLMPNAHHTAMSKLSNMLDALPGSEDVAGREVT
ncbi:site-specific integrase [Cellulosimicrobium sp. Marseille-Q4280]|uniref:tyrosine-type recombinase/integrase n=1 Tax=Cellulosimicrobium sp. Marseille-Q4280 TaxID=2937992 RepID=UPI00203F8B46|nr:site-specific integrase [Cellulosimicrobium sp. Marseille-Q4280]